MFLRFHASWISAALLIGLATLSVPGVASADVPTTTPTNVTVEPSPPAGRLTFAATSTAALVQFQVDDAPALTPVAVQGGTATINWESWGAANGAHSVAA